MKSIVYMFSLMMLMASCNSSNEDTTFINAPIEEVKLIVQNETFTVDFRFDFVCNELAIFEALSDEFAKLKTKDDLINFYKNCKPIYLPSYSSMWPDNGERIFARVEYMLAQECFSDRCDSETRKKILQLAANHQKAKYAEHIRPSCAKKTGIFLMAVILAKERNGSTKHIDAETLQQALLFLNNDAYVSEDFSNLIIQCSEKFLTNGK